MALLFGIPEPWSGARLNALGRTALGAASLRGVPAAAGTSLLFARLGTRRHRSGAHRRHTIDLVRAPVFAAATSAVHDRLDRR